MAHKNPTRGGRKNSNDMKRGKPSIKVEIEITPKRRNSSKNRKK